MGKIQQIWQSFEKAQQTPFKKKTNSTNLTSCGKNSTNPTFFEQIEEIKKILGKNWAILEVFEDIQQIWNLCTKMQQILKKIIQFSFHFEKKLTLKNI